MCTGKLSSRAVAQRESNCGCGSKTTRGSRFCIKKIRENVPATIYHGVKSLRTLHRANGRLDR